MVYLAYQNQKEINKHRDFIKSLENDLRVNLKGNLVVKGSDIHKELERTLSRNKRVLDDKFPSNSLPRFENPPPPPQKDVLITFPPIKRDW